MAEQASRLGFGIMTGCMVATSLAMAPAMLVAQRARVVDLDGPLLLAKDRPDGLRYYGAKRSHACRQPRRNVSPVQGQERASGSSCNSNPRIQLA